jgi:hypothetical protein
MILTRYLYNKEHVEYSMFLALLNRDKEQAKFWIYELYHSGFKHECFELVWKLYYQLYAGFFVNLEELLKQQTLEWMEDNSRDWTIGTIVENMARREPCIEFYLICKQIQTAPSGLGEYVAKIIDQTADPQSVFLEFTHKYGCFRNKGQKSYASFCDTLSKITMLPLRYAYVSRLFTGVFLLDPNNGFDRKVYVILGKNDVALYKNKPFVQGKSWKILRRERKYQEEIPPDAADAQLDDNWLSHAFGSLVWRQRIEKYGGSLIDGEIKFESEDNEEQFHSWYGMEPDEQPLNTMLRNRTFSSWDEINAKYTCEPFNEWASTYTLSL